MSTALATESKVHSSQLYVKSAQNKSSFLPNCCTAAFSFFSKQCTCCSFTWSYFFVNVTFIMDTRVTFFAWQYSKTLRLKSDLFVMHPLPTLANPGRYLLPLSNFSSKMSFKCCLNQARVQRRRCTRNIYWPQVKATMGYFSLLCFKTKRKVFFLINNLEMHCR